MICIFPSGAGARRGLRLGLVELRPASRASRLRQAQP